MENASKALIMAGSILIALLTIGALVFMFDSISGVEQQKDQNAEIEEILKFNRQFEAFDTVGLRGNDLLTLINKMLDYNQRSNEVLIQGYKKMTMNITFKVDTDEPFKRDTTEELTVDTTGELNKWFDYDTTDKKFKSSLTPEEQTEFKRKYFKCTNVEYDNNTGRIIRMEFKEIDMN